ncbi:MAG: competence/damage-inducible protein A [Armatimonadota bacterium]|nr:competence/damage-inducible protein A [Armatimonadota bacterium]MDR5676601.1 competence/damage-inducible protein A [Armatimonadota bacterium]MDR5689235.1 competence/damage-inducible protein A [Armatimonadota bacterium]MDR7390296.1 competence/damage-inducible protein A [Armatimonadota bacterium]MDR7392786.1 competence/damage-inducible protein A [Armatimonadota bacterium]
MGEVRRAEVISVGTELLLGQITDTNATYICQRLAECGIPVYFRQTVGDNFERVQQAFRLAWSRAELVVFTGGLGPTEDDLTKEAVAAVLGAELVEDPGALAHLEQFFARRGRTMTANQRRQALIPRGAVAIPNRWGTAPGVFWEADGRVVVMVPGVPREMRGMVDDFVVPELRRRGWVGEDVIRSRVLRTVGIGEGQLEELVRDLIHTTNPTVAPLAHVGEVHLRITARGSPEEVSRLLDEAEGRLRERLGDAVYGVDDETLDEVVARLLRDSGLRVAVAESCTGGLVGERLTAVPGSSAYFLGGVVAYGNEAKVKLLGVPQRLLEQFGAVSAEVAEAMARGVRETFRADLGLGVTGVAGPGGGTEAKPVGRVYLAVADPRSSRTVRADFGEEPGREGVRRLASQAALNLLRRYLLERGG